VKLDVNEARTTAPDGPAVHVTVKNPSDHLAFQVRFGIQKSGQPDEILPVFWDDNYIELMPAESREITARYLATSEISGPLELTITGWNIDTTTISLKEAGTTSAQSLGGGR
jgi:exo-1,4-beta-D-glucosaminidase